MNFHADRVNFTKTILGNIWLVRDTCVFQFISNHFYSIYSHSNLYTYSIQVNLDQISTRFVLWELMKNTFKKIFYSLCFFFLSFLYIYTNTYFSFVIISILFNNTFACVYCFYLYHWYFYLLKINERTIDPNKSTNCAQIYTPTIIYIKREWKVMSGRRYCMKVSIDLKYDAAVWKNGMREMVEGKRRVKQGWVKERRRRKKKNNNIRRREDERRITGRGCNKAELGRSTHRGWGWRKEEHPYTFIYTITVFDFQRVDRSRRCFHQKKRKLYTCTYLNLCDGYNNIYDMKNKIKFKKICM